VTDSDNRATILVFSGDMDKVFAAFTVATGAASIGMDTTMFFTFWGIKAIQKGNMTGSSLWGRLMGLMNRGGINVIGPSRFNFLGAGRWMLKNMMRRKQVVSLDELVQMAIDLGVHLLACDTSLTVMEITRDDLIPEVEEIVGVGTFLQRAAGARVQVTF